MIQPQPLLYAHYLETSDVSQLATETLYSGAIESFTSCKASCEKLVQMQNSLSKNALEEIRGLMKIAVSNSVQLHFISTGRIPKDATVGADFKISKTYPVITLSGGTK